MKHLTKIEKLGISEYILDLRIKKFRSVREIAEILKTQNVNISRETIRRFLNKNSID